MPFASSVVKFDSPASAPGIARFPVPFARWTAEGGCPCVRFSAICEGAPIAQRVRHACRHAPMRTTLARRGGSGSSLVNRPVRGLAQNAEQCDNRYMQRPLTTVLLLAVGMTLV